MKKICGGLLLSTLLFSMACEEESPPTSWNFTCEATWYRDDPQGGGTDTGGGDADPIGSGHVVSLARHLRDSRSPASRRSYEQALAEMRSSDYVLFREERRLPR